MKRILTILLALGLLFPAGLVQAAAPVGADTFELLTSPATGADNTGDGGTGAPGDLNYYYVGQSFTTTMRIMSGGTDASNIWVDYDLGKLTASALTDGTYFPSYAGATISGGRVKLTGFRTSGTSSGAGTFGSVTWTADEPSAAAYGTGSPEVLDVNVGVIGATTESNISLGGVDLLDDEEDFQAHIWADTIQPFAENPNPANAASGVSVASLYTFDLRDTLNGEGDNTGVGTGVSTATPPGAITSDDGGGPTSLTAFDAYSCSGIWGTNLCNVTVNPSSPLAIVSDTRNWEYATTYTLGISGFRDLASPAQDQLGDPNGPNTMSPKSFTFTTEADTVPPQVVSETPARGSSGQSVSTNITILLHDKKAIPGTVSGTGIDSSTCSFNVSSPTFALTTFDETDGEVSVTPVDFGFQFVINPGSNFGQNETVSVSAFDCEDLAGNTMVTDTWTFSTADADAPFVDQQSPDDDDVITPDTSLVFHVKDAGSGVDLSSLTVFVNGNYYTDGGGAGTVTSTGTIINFADSFDLNGSNYGGDTTSLSGSASDYTVTIDPELDFDPGEAVPVIVFALDLSGNPMPYVVYAVAVEGNGVSSGGGSSGGSSSSGSGSGAFFVTTPEVNEPSSVIQIDEDSVLVSWTTNLPATGRVVYDGRSHATIENPPNYGYPSSTEEVSGETLYHAIIIDGLEQGVVYEFRPVSRAQGHEVYGLPLRMAVRFAASEPIACEPPPAVESCPVPEIVYVPVPATCPAPSAPGVPTPTTPRPSSPSIPSAPSVSGPVLKITDIGRVTDGYRFAGSGHPGGKVTIIVY